MRTFLVLVLVGVSVPAFAVDKANSQPKPIQISANEAPKSQEAHPIPVRPKLKLYLSQHNDVCYTMHSLQVAREQGSDTTRLVGQRTCTPSSQFQMKSAVQRSK